MYKFFYHPLTELNLKILAIFAAIVFVKDASAPDFWTNFSKPWQDYLDWWFLRPLGALLLLVIFFALLIKLAGRQRENL